MARNRDFSKFRRGQVWWLYESTEETLKKTTAGHVQAKSRPWLIVSCDENNDNARILNVLPISQSSNPNFVAHVSYTIGYENALQVIECEQVITKDMKEFLDRGKYMYTLSDKLMASVTEALVRQLGGDLILPDLKSLIPIIEGLAEARARQLELEKKNQMDSVVSELSVKLADIFNLSFTTPAEVTTPKESELKITPLNEEIQVGKKEEISVVKEEEISITKKEDIKVDLSEPKYPAAKTKPRKTWTEEAMLNYLIDYEAMTKDELMVKYNFNKRATCGQYASKFKKILGMK